MSFKNKQILVTGAAGFIGSMLCHRLIEQGAQITAVDNYSPHCGANPFNLKSVTSLLDFYQKDLSDSNWLDSLDLDFDFVFHLAGQTGHAFSMKEPIIDMNLNLRPTLVLLEYLKKRQSKAPLIFSSTRQIYGKPEFLPVTEDHPIRPPDVNGIHKYACEQLLKLYSDIFKMKTCSLRLTNTFGPHQLIRDSSLGFVGWFVNRALLDQEIQLFGGGKQRRDFCYIDDCVNALLDAATHIDSLNGQAFNLSGPIASLEEVARELTQVAGSGKVQKIDFPEDQKKIDIGDYVGSSNLFSSITNWKCKTSVKDGLKKTIDFYQEHHRHYIGG